MKCRVNQEERSVFCDVISLIVVKRGSYEHVPDCELLLK
jgi:hypothetical protein